MERQSFEDFADRYRLRTEQVLQKWLPEPDTPPEHLHRAMRYSVLGGGKRIRPLLVYATGTVLGVDDRLLDAPAAAIELIHAFSLVHDDLPAMDDDELRRGKPTTHLAFDEATAILAGDALQPLAFQILVTDSGLDGMNDQRVRCLETLSAACGSLGMTGGQAMDLAATGRSLELDALDLMHARKTGCLIHAAVTMAAHMKPDLGDDLRNGLDRFGRHIGLAFQIRDDILDVEGDTTVLGKPRGSDEARNKATYPALMGLAAAKRRADDLYREAMAGLDPLGEAGELLRLLGDVIIRRDR